MLAIRLQRTGRKGHPQYKVIVQDSRFSPKSGKVVFYLGDYNPHTKHANINKEAAETYLKNGAQPSDRAAAIIKDAGVKLPKWYKASARQQKTIKNPEKLRKNRPEGAAEPESKQAETTSEDEPQVAAKKEDVIQEPAEIEEQAQETEQASVESESEEAVSTEAQAEVPDTQEESSK